DVQWAKLEGPNSPFFDAVQVDSGGNDVRIYRGTGFDPVTGNPTFAAPQTYPVGTTPVSVTIQDVSGDGIPDLLVANIASTQTTGNVSVLKGAYDANDHWFATATATLRLNSGGSGPIAVAVRDVTDRTGTGGPDGIPDLVVTNAGSGTLTVLPGVGQGFFN